MYNTILKRALRHKVNGNRFGGLGLAASERKGMFVAPFLSNATQLQPPNRFEQTLCHKLQVSVLLCTLKPEF